MGTGIQTPDLGEPSSRPPASRFPSARGFTTTRIMSRASIENLKKNIREELLERVLKKKIREFSLAQ
jgi:hypothetical protein